LRDLSLYQFGLKPLTLLVAEEGLQCPSFTEVATKHFTVRKKGAERLKTT
jgi:hypothetical protein